jgi:hypothetical protein
MTVMRNKESNMQNDNRLRKEYLDIGKKHRISLLKISARSVLGSSVIRVFKGESKGRLLKYLVSIDLENLWRLKDEAAYKSWFENHLSKLAQEIKKSNTHNTKIYPGYKWGHATKILNLYIREVVEYKRYFNESKASKIRKWLYVPIDSQVMNMLCKLGHTLPFKKIKDIDTAKKFYDVQDFLGRAASAANVPRIWFDDVWVDRDL